MIGVLLIGRVGVTLAIFVPLDKNAASEEDVTVGEGGMAVSVGICCVGVLLITGVPLGARVGRDKGCEDPCARTVAVSCKSSIEMGARLGVASGLKKAGMHPLRDKLSTITRKRNFFIIAPVDEVSFG